MSSPHEPPESKGSSNNLSTTDASDKELIVIDSDGDLILKIMEGSDEEELVNEEQDSNTNVRSSKSTAHEHGLLKRISGLALSDTGGSDFVLVKVSKAQICASSSFFEGMFGGDWVEAQHEFSKEKPPTITLAETNGKAAVGILRAMHRLPMFPDDEPVAFECLKAAVCLAEQWIALKCFERSYTEDVGSRALGSLPQSNNEERHLIFTDQLVDIMDMMDIIKDARSYQDVTWFMLEHFRPGTYWSIHNSFVTKTQTRKVLESVELQALYIRETVVNEVVELLDAAVDPDWHVKSTRAKLLPLIKAAVKPKPGIAGCSDDCTPCERKLYRCRSLLLLLTTIAKDSTEPFYGSLKDLATLLLHAHSSSKPEPLYDTCKFPGKCKSCAQDIEGGLRKIIEDLNALVRPLCIFCFKEGWPRGRPFRFACEEHYVNYSDVVKIRRKWWQIAPSP